MSCTFLSSQDADVVDNVQQQINQIVKEYSNNYDHSSGGVWPSVDSSTSPDASSHVEGLIEVGDLLQLEDQALPNEFGDELMSSQEAVIKFQMQDISRCQSSSSSSTAVASSSVVAAISSGNEFGSGSASSSQTFLQPEVDEIQEQIDSINADPDVRV